MDTKKPPNADRDTLAAGRLAGAEPGDPRPLLEKSARRDERPAWFADAPLFTSCPPPRCHADREGGGGALCGELATRVEPGAAIRAPRYVCDRHATPIAVPLRAPFAVRRVRINAVIDFAGASWAAGPAQVEAVERLRRGVEALGGCVDVLSALSMIGRYAGQAPERPQPDENRGG